MLQRSVSLRFRLIRALCALLSLATVAAAAESGADGVTNAPGRPDRGYAYLHDTVASIPWSIHIFKISLARRDLAFTTTLGGSNLLGMSTVAEQLKAFPAGLGTPLAAVNGDFYVNEPEPLGDPRDLQIRDGELISAPAGHACFWIDPEGRPQSTNVFPRLRVRWPDGSETPIGLNELREAGAAVLYTRAAGSHSWTRDGTELVLERNGEGPWLPLRAGQQLGARVRSVQDGGHTPLDADTLVLSLGPKLVAAGKRLAPGAVVQVITETVPELTGVTTAIGGGPTLVRKGKAMEWSGFLLRHPRTALGWNQDHVFLVQVDGRQSDLSVGMTFPELADYLVNLGCQNAVNLDGGGSATLWALGQVVNSPSEGQQRPGANSLVVYLRRPQATPTGRQP
ncbi:MAG: hypothetical protein RIS76_3638 [Verrucomicrobiota bacterium]|jgi:hypothetical protein